MMIYYWYLVWWCWVLVPLWPFWTRLRCKNTNSQSWDVHLFSLVLIISFKYKCISRLLSDWRAIFRWLLLATGYRSLVAIFFVHFTISRNLRNRAANNGPLWPRRSSTNRINQVAVYPSVRYHQHVYISYLKTKSERIARTYNTSTL